MESGIPIVVRKVANGYVVQPQGTNVMPDPAATTYVFETAESMLRWVGDHFATPGQS